MSQSSVLVVEDDASLSEALCDTLEMAGYPVAIAENGRVALEVIAEKEIGMVVSDVQMKPMDGHSLLKQIKSQRPEMPVLLMTAYGNVQKAVEAMQDGAVDYLVKPFDAEVLVNMVGRYMPGHSTEEHELVAVDKRTQEVAALATRVADSDVTVMISGESGVGKEVLARHIHINSKRAEGPFVAINCAAIPDNMLEATLFGYEKGAFTGAYQATPGKFEQAQGGTLLLDEISEMDLSLQAKLLRVLQEREVERLGARKMIDLDVRVLATSNREMRKEVSEGRFREDLFYRLNVFPLHLPSLRDRPADILPIAERILERAAIARGRQIPGLAEEARRKLCDHHWQGNVRELDNVLQRALILQAGIEIHADDIQFDKFDERQTVNGENGQVAEKLSDDLKSHEQRMIIETLSTVRGSRKAAAEKLGISQRTLRYKLARMRDDGINLSEVIGAESA